MFYIVFIIQFLIHLFFFGNEPAVWAIKFKLYFLSLNPRFRPLNEFQIETVLVRREVPVVHLCIRLHLHFFCLLKFADRKADSEERLAKLDFLQVNFEVQIFHFRL